MSAISRGRQQLSRGASLTNTHRIQPQPWPDPAEKPSVMILYVGGTIGMFHDPESGSLVPRPRWLEKQLSELQEMSAAEMPHWVVEEYDPIMDSSDMDASDWRRIAEDIEKHYFDYDGFVLIMGTDTMAYCACALSFMLENLNKPVVLTGGQIPLSQVVTDARRNLVSAVLLAGVLDIPEVVIFFNQSLLRGNRAQKIDNWGLNAFDSPNFPHLATLGLDVMLNESLLVQHPRARFRLRTGYCNEVVVLHMLPGLSDEILMGLLAVPSIRGLVLRAYGAGNVQSKKTSFLERLKQLTAAGVVVVVCTQCARGTVYMDAYATGQVLQQCGAISAGDMTLEAVTVKLSWLLGQNLPPKTVLEFFQHDLRGELSTVQTHLGVQPVQSQARVPASPPTASAAAAAAPSLPVVPTAANIFPPQLRVSSAPDPFVRSRSPLRLRSQLELTSDGLAETPLSPGHQ